MARDARTEPQLMEGGLHVDGRGSLAFFNTFPFAQIERFYVIRPARSREIRGWIGHRTDMKWFSAVEGELLIAVVQPEEWQASEEAAPVRSFRLSADRPQVLAVPPGNATAIVGITDHSGLLVFSTGCIENAPADSYRFPPERWPVNHMEEV